MLVRRAESRPAMGSSRRALLFEPLEGRNLLTSVPFGATADDTAEYMLGDVLVTLVLMESDGSQDQDLETWTPEQVAEVKQRVQEGLQWWVDLLDQQASVHALNFEIDFTYADQPAQTGYEPISRRSDDFSLWLDDFFEDAGIARGTSFSDRIRQFNHQQRLAHETNWAYTIFVVNAANDPDSRFDTEGSFSRAFAFAGGRFFVTTSERPASTYAHETAHIFWAMDEYAGGRPYSDHRGYYDTQNLNGKDGHPNPDLRQRSIMDSHGIAFRSHAVSASALEMIGWRDSDQDGVFDVLDVPHQLDGTGEFDAPSSQYHFSGAAAVQALPNLNPDGQGNDITLNEIRRVEVRFDQSEWRTVEQFGAYEVDLDLVIDVPSDASRIEIRALDDRSGVVSNSFLDVLNRPAPSWQNPVLAVDVNDDQLVTPLDALLVINELNLGGGRELPPLDSPPRHYLDVSGDTFLSALDALLVINDLNTSAAAAAQPADLPIDGSRLPDKADAEGELGRVAAALHGHNAVPDSHRAVEGRARHVENEFGGDELHLAPIRSARWIDLALAELTDDSMRIGAAEFVREFDSPSSVEDLANALTGVQDGNPE